MFVGFTKLFSASENSYSYIFLLRFVILIVSMSLFFSSGVAFPTARHQELYPTSVSFSAINLAAWAQTFADMLTRFQWSSISLIYDRWGHNSVYYSIVHSIRDVLSPSNYPNFHILPLEIDTRREILDSERADALRRAKNVSRGMSSLTFGRFVCKNRSFLVIILAFQANETRKFMVRKTSM